jgi:hypothetical protein
MTITSSTGPISGATEAIGTKADGEATGSDPGAPGIPEEPGAGPVRFQDSVVLSKGEVFGACQALADADRVLLRTGGKSEALALGDLFELLEARLSH